MPEIHEKTWRNNWAVKNVLSEIPIAGHFFKKPSLKEAAPGICKESVMYVTSTAAMAIVMFAQEDSMMMDVGHTLLMVAEMAVSMAAGMFVGHVGYNVASSAVEQCFSHNAFQNGQRASLII